MSPSLDSSRLSDSSEQLSVSDHDSTVSGVYPSAHRYPLSLVWTPIPVLSWIFPFIGHVGICSSKGIIHDFSGPYTITRQKMLFGWPTKYVPLHIAERERYEKSLSAVTACYEGYVMYNFFTHNCHNYVCSVMNEYGGHGGGAYDVREGELQYLEEMDPDEFPAPSNQVEPITISGYENHWMYKFVRGCTEWIFGKNRWNIIMIALLVWWYGIYVSSSRRLYTIIPVIVTWTFIFAWIFFVSSLFF